MSAGETEVGEKVRPWYRIEMGWMHDGRVMETGFAWAWMIIIDTLKRGDGVASESDLTDRALCAQMQVPCHTTGRAWTIRDAYVDAGLLEKMADGRWTTPNWRKFQPDPTANERQKRRRERNARASQEAEARVTACHGDKRDVTPRHAASPCVTPDGDGDKDMDNKEETCRSPLAPARTHTREEAQKTADPTGSLADLEALVLECMPPGRRRGALQLSPVVARQLAELVATFGHDAVKRTLEECGEADMPVAMARKRLTRGAQGSTQATHAPTGPIVGPDPRLPAYQPFKPDTKVIPPDMQARNAAMLKQFLADTAGASN